MQAGFNEVDLLPMKAASDKLLGECNLKVNDSFMYVYDFGDTFIFVLEVISISKELSKSTQNNHSYLGKSHKLKSTNKKITPRNTE
jgi:hypothetical protein